MNFSNYIDKSFQVIKSNAPEILTALGITGLISTAYLTAKASFEAAALIEHVQYMMDTKQEKSYPLTTKEKTRLVWRFYIPAGISGGLAIGCIAAAYKGTGRRTAAAVTAYSLTERAFSEYKEKVIEELGKGKEQKIRDTIAQEKVNSNPSASKEVIVAGSGEVLCCELFTRRYFRSDMEKLRRAQNDINAQINSHLYVSMDEFYDLLNLQFTSESGHIGWDSDRLMELEFSTVLSPHGEPCLAFDYNYTKPLR